MPQRARRRGKQVLGQPVESSDQFTGENGGKHGHPQSTVAEPISGGCEPKHSTVTPEALASQNGTEKGRSQCSGRPLVDGSFYGSLCALAGFPNALLEYIHGDVSFVPGHDQRRTYPNCAWPAAQKQDATLESHLDNAVALGGAVLLARFVLNDINPDHQTASAHITHQLQLRRPIRHTLQHV